MEAFWQDPSGDNWGLSDYCQDSEKFSAVTEVTFAELSDEEIDYYIRVYKPMDKAGSYGIQEWIGFIGVCGISGSYFNVMGLPVQCLYTELKNYKSVCEQ